MERSNHFPAKDRTGRRRQELWNPGRASGRTAEGNSRSREGHSFAPGTARWRSGADCQTEKIDKSRLQNRKTATGLIMKSSGYGLKINSRWRTPPGHSSTAAKPGDRAESRCASGRQIATALLSVHRRGLVQTRCRANAGYLTIARRI